VPFADHGLPEPLEEEKRGRGVGDLEEDVCELCGQGLLDERLIGHPVTFFQRTISTTTGGMEVIDGEAHSKRFPSIVWQVRGHRTGRPPWSGRGSGRGVLRPCPSSPCLRKSEHAEDEEGEGTDLRMRGIYRVERRRSEPCFGRKDERVSRTAVGRINRMFLSTRSCPSSLVLSTGNERCHSSQTL
jgi:hypothetical protein